jgi:hypothetical protein
MNKTSLCLFLLDNPLLFSTQKTTFNKKLSSKVLNELNLIVRRIKNQVVNGKRKKSFVSSIYQALLDNNAM